MTITLTKTPCLYKKLYFKLVDGDNIYTGIRHESEIEEMIEFLNIKNVCYE